MGICATNVAVMEEGWRLIKETTLGAPLVQKYNSSKEKKNGNCYFRLHFLHPNIKNEGYFSLINHIVIFLHIRY